MSVSAQVKRTLVKSPPELWAELSDPAALARHLSELGEIRIVRTEPEQAVEWEAPQASGSVQIEASGWGTKVTLTATRTATAAEQQPPTEQQHAIAPKPRPTAAQPLPIVQPPLPTPAQPLLTAGQPPRQLEAPAPAPLGEPDRAQQVVLGPQPKPADDPKPEAHSQREPEHKATPQRGFFAKLFRRRSAKRAALDMQAKSGLTGRPAPEHALEQAPERPSDAVKQTGSSLSEQAEPSTAEPGEPADPRPGEPADAKPADPADAKPAEPADPKPADPADAKPAEPADAKPAEPAEHAATGHEASAKSDIAAELEALEEQTTAVLSRVLDRLGAAHHRPFSRP